MLLDRPHTADVRALELTEFHVADAASFTYDPANILYVTVLLARRLDAADSALIEIKRHLQTGQPGGTISRTVEKTEELLNYSERTKPRLRWPSLRAVEASSEPQGAAQMTLTNDLPNWPVPQAAARVRVAAIDRLRTGSGDRPKHSCPIFRIHIKFWASFWKTNWAMLRIFAYVRVSTTAQTTDNQLGEIAAAGFAITAPGRDRNGLRQRRHSSAPRLHASLEG